LREAETTLADRPIRPASKPAGNRPAGQSLPPMNGKPA